MLVSTVLQLYQDAQHVLKKVLLLCAMLVLLGIMSLRLVHVNLVCRIVKNVTLLLVLSVPLVTTTIMRPVLVFNVPSWAAYLAIMQSAQTVS